MSEEKKSQQNQNKKEEKKDSKEASKEEKNPPNPPAGGGGGNTQAGNRPNNKPGFQGAKKSVYGEKRRAMRGKFGRRDAVKDEYDQKIVDIARVTRVMAGGKRMRFRVCIAIGNKKGDVAIGLAKGADIAIAVQKAVSKAKKNIIKVSIVNDTIPHEIYQKTGAAKILLKPAKRGHGVIAGGAVRIILELSGVKNVTSKILGTNNKVNNVKCTIEALKNLRKVEKKNKKGKDLPDMPAHVGNTGESKK